jgi:uncharacterized membrane protein (UPF0182 family)
MQTQGTPARRPRSRALVPTLVVLGMLALLFGVFTNVWTERLWFESVGFSRVFTTSLLTQAGLFLVFGALAFGTVTGTAWLAYRLRPRYRPMSVEQQSLERYREAIEPSRRSIVITAGAVLGITSGLGAAASWQTFLSWLHRRPFGETDAQFNVDVGFYVFEYPWWRFVLSFAFTMVILALITAVIVHYLYGGIRLQSPGERATPAAIAHVSALAALLLLLKAAAYWLDRYGLVLTDGNLFTGAGYTAVNAILPAKTILTFIAVVCAVLFAVAVFRRSWTLAGIGLGLLVLSSVLLAAVWPALVQQFQVRPSEADRESPYIERNIAATRDAYQIGRDLVDIQEYNAVTTATAGQLQDDAETIPNIRLLDPAVVEPTFQQLQQVRGFYSFANPLDVARYEIEGETRDLVVAVRELDQSGIPAAQQNWINQATVFTHGFGFVAAYSNQRNADGSPVWAEEDIPPVGVLGDYEPRIYFGENSPEYSIVGAPEGAEPVEFDIPTDAADGGGQRNTYSGDGGVPVGSLLNKVLFATKFQEGNILLSNRVNAESQVLWDRHPRDRVEKVAPWLITDGDPYPAIVDGRIVWVVDGYTASSSYPYAQRIGLETLTSDSLTAQQQVAQQQVGTVNYIRNSVKATVDAYDGTVTLYEWDENDPILQTWQAAFPGSVVAKADIPENLLVHLRYPEDYFKVQRGLLSRYHVSDPSTFYGGQDFWEIPPDPAAATPVPVPPYYLTLAMPGQERATFSLTTTFTPRNRQNLAAFMAVNADASSSDYGTIRVLRLPGSTQVDGPSQVANAFETDQAIAQATLPLRQSGAETREGNLLTLPIGGGLAYVQPLFVERRAGDASFPLLRLVFASFGGTVGVGSTLQEALDDVFQGNAGTQTGEEVAPGDGGEDGAGGGTSDLTQEEQLAQALSDAKQAYADAQAALREGDFAAYGEAIDRLGEAIDRAGVLSGAPVEAPATVEPSPDAGATATEDAGSAA